MGTNEIILPFVATAGGKTNIEIPLPRGKRLVYVYILPTGQARPLYTNFALFDTPTNGGKVNVNLGSGWTQRMSGTVGDMVKVEPNYPLPKDTTTHIELDIFNFTEVSENMAASVGVADE